MVRGRRANLSVSKHEVQVIDTSITRNVRLFVAYQQNLNSSSIAAFIPTSSPSKLDRLIRICTPYFRHPKDPYKRIDILASTRPVKVALVIISTCIYRFTCSTLIVQDGVTLAESGNPFFLLETTLRTRYYLPPTSVNWELLSKSNTETYCPYKGKANYYNATVNGKEYKDIVWYYQYPTAESAAIVGHLCFYNEKVDIWVDGVKEKQ